MGQTVCMTTTQKTEWDGELTNRCTCTNYNETTEEWEESNDCYGTCWDDALEFFHESIKDFYENNPSYEWKVEGLPLWNNSVSGGFMAKTFADFVRGITVNAEWRLLYKLENKTLHLNLAHHDVPTGRGYTVRYYEGE